MEKVKHSKAPKHALKRRSATKRKSHIVEDHASETLQPFTWATSFSQILISEYAIPFTRMVESKLVQLQNKNSL